MKSSEKKQSWNDSGIRKRKPVLITVLLLLAIVAGSFVLSGRINRLEEERSFERLYEETGNLAREVEKKIFNNREELEVLASMLSEYEELDSAEVQTLLHSYSGIGITSRLELLFPDDTVLTENGEVIDAEGLLSFEKEAVKGAHISDREQDLEGYGGYVVRNYVPVIRNGQTVAMLYTVIDLEEFPAQMPENSYGGDAAVYIIDGNTGDFLVDTWHGETGGNIWALGEREMADGYDSEQMQKALTEGDASYVIFISETTGEWLFFYFEPMTVNEWRVALSVPESVVFSGANAIKNILNIFLVFETVCFILYFVWVLHYVKKETTEKQRRLDTVQYIYDVEKLLFTAHEKRENMEKAMGEIARFTSAEGICFLIIDKFPELRVFIWEKERLKTENRLTEGQDIAGLLKYFRQGHDQFTAYDRKILDQIWPGAQWLPVRNMTAVPVKRIDGEICGILAAVNLPLNRTDPALLKNIEFSFSMFCANLQTYQAIRERSEKDLLSGLYNRNRYEMDLAGFKKMELRRFACIYIDVNGLHELNNHKGHDAGDKMLRTVAEQIRAELGVKNAYRIGGDEFLVFVADISEDMVNRLGNDIAENLEKEKIHVSIGIQWSEKVISLDELIKAAEKKMYAAKKQYYEKEGNDRRERR